MGILCAVGLATLPAAKMQGQTLSKPAEASAKRVTLQQPSVAHVVTGASDIETGRQEFLRYHCWVCHGTDLKGGVPNANAQGGEVPALVHVAEDYTMEEALNLIRDGRSSPLDKPAGAAPPIYMPSWKGIVQDQNIHAIASYIWSKQEKDKASSW